MAELTREGDELVLRLTTAEKWEGMHGDLRAPMAAVYQDAGGAPFAPWAKPCPKPLAAWGGRKRVARRSRAGSRASQAEVLDHAHGAAMAFGFKIGTLMPGVVEVATVQGPTRRLFVAVHHATPRGLRIRLGAC